MPRHPRVVRTAAARRRDRAVTVLAAVLLGAMGLAAVLVGPDAEAGPAQRGFRPAAAGETAPLADEPTSPTDGPDFPAAASATTFRGSAFDICTAPSRSTMAAWRASSYGAVGVYVSGRNRACAQPQLDASWVRDVTAMGWRLLPISMGSQAPCRENGLKKPKTAGTAGATGTAEAAAAVLAVKNLGMLPGTAIYADIEPYDSSRTRCSRAVASYLTAWTRELHRQGYLAGIYGTLDSGLGDAAARYGAAAYARPDVVWLGNWDRSPSLRGWPQVPDNRWAGAQRVKQYRGDHRETHGGVGLVIDSDAVDAPVATVAHSYAVTSGAPLNLRRDPRPTADQVGSAQPGTDVAVVCQVSGAAVEGSTVWDKLVDGSYVADAYLAAGARKPLPACTYPVQVVAAGGAATRSAADPSAASTGTLPLGTFAPLVCVPPTPGWVRLADGSYLATSALPRWNAALPDCT